MIKEYNKLKYYSREVVLTPSVQTTIILDLKFHTANLLTGVSFFYRQKLPCSTAVSDYIDLKTTSGGLTLIKSMFNNTFLIMKISACITATLATSDLNPLIRNDRKAIRRRTSFAPCKW